MDNVQNKSKKKKEESKLFCVEDYEKLAQKVMDPLARSYYGYGNERGWCLRDSVQAFSRYRIRSRALKDVSHRTLSTTVLGQSIPYPIGVAPTGNHVMVHPDAEKATAKGAVAAGALLIHAVDSNETIADVAASAPGGLRWMQIYMFRDRQLTEHIVRETERAGYKAVVVAVDSPYSGLSPKLLDMFNNNGLDHPKYCMRNFTADIPSFWESRAFDDSNNFKYLYDMQFHASATWDDIKWIRTITSLPIVCKGILSAESAKEAAGAGVDGILVSAHGGRQLDGAPAPIDAVAEVVDAVRGSGIEVYMDGGIRTGTDVFKALGRGARAVFVGRPVLWGLACQGSKGVENILEILVKEFDKALAISGCTSPEGIPLGMVVHESYYHQNNMQSKL
nr:2-Hydroxyacid oxidase 1-like [Lytechinus pictus]